MGRDRVRERQRWDVRKSKCDGVRVSEIDGWLTWELWSFALLYFVQNYSSYKRVLIIISKGFCVRVVNRLDANVVERKRLFTFDQRLVDYHPFVHFFVFFFFFFVIQILMKMVDLHIAVGTYSYSYKYRCLGL